MTPGPDSLRLGFLGHQSFTLAAPLLASRSGTGLAPNPGCFRDPENLQCRAVFIQYQRAVVLRQRSALPESNPLLTHGTVESPAKLFLRRFLKNREPPPPISPVVLASNTCPG